jgi:hemophore-related protein
MHIPSIGIRRGLIGACIGSAAGTLVAVTIALPTAGAQPGCTAAGLSNAIGVVSTQTGEYLAGHPGANDAVTNAGAAPDPEGSIRAYFAAHPQEWGDLQRIAQPLRALRQQCNVQVAPADIARLFDAMAG